MDNNSINLKGNDNFSSFNKIDLRDLKNFLNSYYIEYRENLNLNSNITFGTEIETEYAAKKRINKELSWFYKNKNWKQDSDPTIVKGVEIKSPILKDSKSCWKNLKSVCEILQKYSHIHNKAGGHIHIGAQILGDDIENLYNFLYLWGVYENILFRYGYGEFLNGRPKIDKYAAKIHNKCIISYHKYIYNTDVNYKFLFYLLAIKRNNAFSLFNLNLFDHNKIHPTNTIEFRCPNGTLNPIIWQNNINVFTKMLSYCTKSYFNKDIIDKRRISNKEIKRLDYSKIYFDQALEFADLIFDNNLDKINFLRQYTKSFKTSHFYKKAKKFTK